MAIDCLVDQPYLHHSLGDWLYAFLHLPVHTSSILLATPVYFVQDPTAIANKGAMQFFYGCVSCPASHI